MTWRDTLRTAIEAVRSHRLRSVLTMLGILIGITAVILTVAIIAAIALTLRRRPGTRHQDPAKQVQVRREDRVRIVSMPAEPRREVSP